MVWTKAIVLWECNWLGLGIFTAESMCFPPWSSRLAQQLALSRHPPWVGVDGEWAFIQGHVIVQEHPSSATMGPPPSYRPSWSFTLPPLQNEKTVPDDSGHPQHSSSISRRKSTLWTETTRIRHTKWLTHPGELLTLDMLRHSSDPENLGKLLTVHSCCIDTWLEFFPNASFL